jgi:hypothetical protein
MSLEFPVSGPTRLRALALSVFLFAAACTAVDAPPEAGRKSQQIYHAVVVDKVSAADSSWAYLNPYFRAGFLRRLKELGSFAIVTETVPTAPASDTLIANAVLTDARKGDATKRELLGFGTGAENVTAVLELIGSNGKPLGKLQIRKAYTGSGVATFVNSIDLEVLATQAGEQAAQALTDWSRGKRATASN